MASHEPPWLSGLKRERSVPSVLEKYSPPDIGITKKTSGSSSRSLLPPKRQRIAAASSFSTPEFLPKNKKKQETSNVRSISSSTNSPITTSSSSTSPQVSTSSGKVFSPFWTSLNVQSKNMAQHSTWFRTLKIQNSMLSTTPKNLQTISSQFVTSLWPVTTDEEPLPYVEVDNQGSLKIPKIPKKLPAPVKAMKIRLHLRNEEDRVKLSKTFGCVRWTYNQCVHHYRETKKRTSLKDLRALFVKDESEGVTKNPWLKEVGFDIRDEAIKDFRTALKGNFTRLKTGDITSFKMNYRSKKNIKSQTFYVKEMDRTKEE